MEDILLYLGLQNSPALRKQYVHRPPEAIFLLFYGNLAGLTIFFCPEDPSFYNQQHQTLLRNWIIWSDWWKKSVLEIPPFVFFKAFSKEKTRCQRQDNFFIYFHRINRNKLFIIHYCCRLGRVYVLRRISKIII